MYENSEYGDDNGFYTSFLPNAAGQTSTISANLFEIENNNQNKQFLTATRSSSTPKNAKQTSGEIEAASADTNILDSSNSSISNLVKNSGGVSVFSLFSTTYSNSFSLNLLTCFLSKFFGFCSINSSSISLFLSFSINCFLFAFVFASTQCLIL
jgi:hypothetical protein